MIFRLSTRLRHATTALLLGSGIVLSSSLFSAIVESKTMGQEPAKEKEAEPKKDESKPKEEPKPEAPKPKEEPKPEAPKPKEEAKPKSTSAVKEPVAGRVYQRNDEGRADIDIVLGEGINPESIVGVTLSAGSTRSGFPAPNPGLVGVTYRDGKLRNVPTGGPYQVNVVLKSDKTAGAFAGGATMTMSIAPVFVGDLWILAGQSNMEGVGDLIDVTPPSERVQILGMNGAWSQAEEPLHWLVDSPDVVHSGNPDDRAARSESFHKNRTKGAGLGLPFGVALASATNIPIGLVACAHGGTSMEQWNPAKKGEGGNSLYGSMLRQVKLAGGKARGVLWYQGESDAMGGAAGVYPKVFADFIAAVREDLGQPDLPFYLVQIGRFVNGNESKGWNAVQDAQRQIPDRVANTAVVAAIDLELDDLIHVGTPGLKRLGNRLAQIALREVYGQVGATTPTFDRVNKRGENSLVIKFKGVNRAPVRAGIVAGYAPAPAGEGSIGFGQAPGRPLQGLHPARHIAGFSIRKEDGSEIPLIFDAAVGLSNDTVVLKLIGKVPAGAQLWYGHGLDPYCNLADALDMAVPVFGPIPLDDLK